MVGVHAPGDHPDLDTVWQCDYSDHFMSGCLAGPGTHTQNDTSAV